MSKQYWIVGNVPDLNKIGWHFQGVFDNEQDAVKACEGHDLWFVGPATLNQVITSNRLEWPNSYYPAYEAERAPKKSYLKPSNLKMCTYFDERHPDLRLGTCVDKETQVVTICVQHKDGANMLKALAHFYTVEDCDIGKYQRFNITICDPQDQDA